MYLRLKAREGGVPQFEIPNEQKDYDLAENDDLIAFIYGYPFSPDAGKWISADDILSNHSEYKMDYIHKIDGVYSILVVDKTNKTIWMITDRYGIYTLFYYIDKEFLIISDSIGEILPHVKDARSNELSIMEYMYFGFKLGSKTHIEGVKQFEGASKYTIGPELSMDREVYWYLIEKSKPHKMTKEEYRESFNRHIKTAFELEKNIVIPLSGGLDTRTILSSSIAQNLNFECYTYGLENSPDVKIAKKICKHLNIKHTYFKIDTEWIMNIPLAFERGAVDHNGLIPPYSSTNLESFREYARDRLIFMGVLGNEVWRGLLADKELDSYSEEMIIDTIMNQFLHNKTRMLKIFKGYDDKEVLNKIRNSLEKEIFASGHSKRTIDRFETFVLRTWGSNWTSNAFKGAGKYFKIYSAYLNKDLLPQVVLQDRNERIIGSMQKYIISRNNPYLATVKLDATDIRHGASINGGFGSKFIDLQAIVTHYSRAMVNYLPKRLFKRDMLKTPFFTDYPNWLRDNHEKFITGSIYNNNDLTEDMFNKKNLDEMVWSFFNGDDSQEPCVTRMLGLQLWIAEVVPDSEVKISNNVLSSNSAPAVHQHGLRLDKH